MLEKLMTKDEALAKLQRAQATLARSKETIQKTGERVAEGMAIVGGNATGGAMMGFCDADGTFEIADKKLNGGAIVGAVGLLAALPGMVGMYGKGSDFLCNYGMGMTGYVVGRGIETLVREKRQE